MRIAILAHDYHIVRVFQLLLQVEQHTVTCFGKLPRLESSQQAFDLLIFNPGKPSSAGAVLEHITLWRPEVRRIMLTSSYENVTLARQQGLPVLFLPCSRRLFLALVENRQPLTREEVSRGT